MIVTPNGFSASLTALATAAAAPAVPAVATPPREERAPAGADLLVLRDVSIAFGGLRALEGVALVVPERGLYGIIGPNGAGKTTLFRIITGEDKPDDGQVTVAWT